jgi:hypothetical protein
VHGVVLDHAFEGEDDSEPYNAAEIERLTGARVLASLPFEPSVAVRERLLAEELSGKVQF